MNELTKEKNNVIEFFEPHVPVIIETVEKAISNCDKLTLEQQLDKSLLSLCIRRNIITLIKNISDVIIDNGSTINQDYIVFRSPTLTYHLRVGKMAKNGLPATHNDTIIRNTVNFKQGYFDGYETLDLSLLYSIYDDSQELEKLHLIKMEGKEIAWRIDLLDLEYSKNEVFRKQSNLSHVEDNNPQPTNPNRIRNPLIAKK